MRVFRSNYVEVLAAQLAGVLAAEPNDDPMRPDVVVVHSPGVARWRG